MSLIEITNRIEAFKTELADKTKAFETERDSLRKRIDALMKERQIVNDGLDLNQIQIAEECMIFQGNPGEVRHGAYSDQDRSSVRGKAIQDAIRIIASTDDPFRKEYIGVKNYSGFGDQRAKTTATAWSRGTAASCLVSGGGRLMERSPKNSATPVFTI